MTGPLGDKTNSVIGLVQLKRIEDHLGTVINMKNLPDVLKPKEVEQYLRISHPTLRKMEKLGEIRAIRIGLRGDRRYLKKDVASLLKYYGN